MRGAELAGDQCRVRKNPGAESEVDPVPDQIERVVRGLCQTNFLGFPRLW